MVVACVSAVVLQDHVGRCAEEEADARIQRIRNSWRDVLHREAAAVISVSKEKATQHYSADLSIKETPCDEQIADERAPL